MESFTETLKEATLQEIKDVMSIPGAPEQKKMMVENVQILAGVLNEEEKLELEREKLEVEKKRSSGQFLTSCAQIGVGLMSTLLMIAAYTMWQKNGHYFEENGTERSPYSKSLINNMLPRIR